MTRACPDTIRQARRAIDRIDGLELLGDLKWLESQGAWGFPCEVRTATTTRFISAQTNWWVLVGEDYPWAPIEVYPAKDGGVAVTFPHQDLNLPGNAALPWRDGDVCLRSPEFILGRDIYDPDPIGHPGRLEWYLRRLVEWVRRASTDALLVTGDPFELPKLPSGAGVVLFDEDGLSLELWRKCSAKSGIFDIVAIGDETRRVYFAAKFRTEDNKVVVERSPPLPPAATPEVATGVWLRCKAVPVVDPYDIPRTWGDWAQIGSLSESFAAQLRRVSRHCRDGKPTVLLVGFPVPNTVGGEVVRMHWEALLLPALCQETALRGGFRNIDDMRWQLDRAGVLAPREVVSWMRSENLSKSELVSRGQLPQLIASKRYLLIGAGALGSVLAELLVRSGVDSLAIVDGENFEAANLARHVLEVRDVGRNKAVALADRLGHLRSGLVLSAFSTSFGRSSMDKLAKIWADADVVLDCTGSDALIRTLSQSQRDNAVHFCSVSVGYRARRLYVFSAHSQAFPVDMMRDSLRNVLARDRREFQEGPPAHAGVGCWHPAFPARADDMCLLASAAIRQLEVDVSEPTKLPRLTVLERQDDGNGFAALRRADTSA